MDHHDKAYDWAERRKLETHPTDRRGAAGGDPRDGAGDRRPGVRAAEVARAGAGRPSRRSSPQRPTTSCWATACPPEWLADVRQATEDTLLALADHLPAEAAEALLELATGGKPRCRASRSRRPADPFDAPRCPAPLPRDDERRGAGARPRLPVGEVDGLPAPRRSGSGWSATTTARRGSSGSAGTGKTIVALHRAVHLARTHPDARVLLTTFSDTLANALRTKLRRLIGNEPRLAERIEVHSLDAIGAAALRGALRAARASPAATSLRAAARATQRRRWQATSSARTSCSTEWEQVVDAWQLETWEAYRDVAAPRPQDAAAGGAARRAVVDLRAGPRRALRARS